MYSYLKTPTKIPTSKQLQQKKSSDRASLAHYLLFDIFESWLFLLCWGFYASQTKEITWYAGGDRIEKNTAKENKAEQPQIELRLNKK